MKLNLSLNGVRNLILNFYADCVLKRVKFSLVLLLNC